MNKKIILYFMLISIFCVSVFGYGGGGGGAITYISHNTKNDLTTLSFTNTDSFTKVLDLDVVKSIEYVSNSRQSGKIEIYEVDSRNAKLIYNKDNLVKLFRIKTNSEFEFIKLKLEFKQDEGYNYYFQHQVGDKWENIFMADFGDYRTVTLRSLSNFVLIKDAKPLIEPIPKTVIEAEINDEPVTLIQEPEIITEEIISEEVITEESKHDKKFIWLIVSGFILLSILIFSTAIYIKQYVNKD